MLYGKVSIGNCITSIKEILRVNFLDIFEKINGVEEILKKDPSQVYEKMDYKTKEYYREKIQDIAEKTNISEIYIAKKALELASMQQDEKKKHIGYYLIDDGESELIKSLGLKERLKLSSKEKAKIYKNSLFFLTFICSGIITWKIYDLAQNFLISIIFFVLSIIPISEIILQLINYGLSKLVKPKLIPKLDFYQGIPEECATFVVIPTIIKDSKKVEELMKKLEVYYHANKSKNIYFALLGDASASGNEKEKYDKEVVETGKRLVQELNEKYGELHVPIFHFLYRKRKWNSSEKCYLGWERKRGLLCEFNELLVNKKDDFLCNTIPDNMPEIKYIITLDSDTNLVLNSAFELIGAMAHILNKPVLNKEKTVVVEGHGIIQPRIGVDLQSSRTSLFTKIFAGSGGTDSYTNAISDLYQDNFDEGIFTGKGIYDLKIFEQILGGTIPENTVLSHDLLEGSYLRCGLASDILLLDGYPAKYNAYMTRLQRWIRGDWQIAKWLTNRVVNQKKEEKENPLNMLSKFKILDNLRRSLLPIMVMLLLLLSIFDTKSVWCTSIALIAILMPTILDNINYIVFRKEIKQGYVNAYKSFTTNITSLQASIIRGILDILFLPYKAYIAIVAIVKTIYRMIVSKQNLLEWMTAEEAEKQSKVDLGSYYKNMLVNVVIGVLFLLTKSVFFNVLGILWIIAPIIAWYMSKPYKIVEKREELKEQEKEFLYEVGMKTWNFFFELMNEENNFLPPDNYQEDRNEKIARRTSPTNIGLALLSVISAYDLKYIDESKCIDLLERMLESISKLQKWNGHLYNWYNTKTLEPLIPRYISSVDSGNFVGYMYVVRQFLLSLPQQEKITWMLNNVEKIIRDTDFSKLYDEKKRLFSIGFNIEENKLTDSYYDLMASEARQTSFVSIAKGDISAKHWENLSRTLTTQNRYKGLISWSGTAFEYLMPNINMQLYPGSLLDESCKFAIMSQKEYAKQIGIPWGISESAYNMKDLNSNYQYKAFGIPWLGLKRGLADEMVVSSYGLILALPYFPKEVLKNLKILEQEGMYQKYGFYESIDYTTARLKYGQKSAPVKTYMAHHQGLILISINNLLNANIIKSRFSQNEEIQAVDVLLQERMPEKAIIMKEKKEKVEKLKLKDYESYSERILNKPDGNLPEANVISNGIYTICTKQNGESFSKWGNIQVNRFKETSDYSQGNFFYIKNIRTKKIWTNAYNREIEKPDKYQVAFSPGMTKITRTDGNIETITKIITAPDDAVEIRRLELKNNSNQEEILEITNAFEPVLSTSNQDNAHPAFNNLFLKFDYENEENILTVKRKKREKNQEDIFMSCALYTDCEVIGEFEYEIDKEKFIGRENIKVPDMVKESKPFSKKIGLVVEPIVAMKRTIKINPGQKVVIDGIVAISTQKQNSQNLLKKYKNREEVTKTFELIHAKVEAEGIYLGVKGKEIEVYQKILSYLIFKNPLKEIERKTLPSYQNYKQCDLWQYGISGDLPILLVKIKDINDLYVVDQVLKAYEYFRVKGIKIDLVLQNEEANSYEQYVKEEIDSKILNHQLEFLKNQNGGIFIIDSNILKQEEKDLLIFRANLVLDASLGNIETQLEEKEEEYKETRRNMGYEEIKEPILISDNVAKTQEREKNLKYDNDYGGFNENGLEYHIRTSKENKLPTVWSHILANEQFGTIITQNLGGYTWNKNSRLNRITAWHNNPMQDIPSENIYLKDEENGRVWSFSNVCNKENLDFDIIYGFGYASYKIFHDEIWQELQMFVPIKDNIKVNLLKLKNTSNKRKKLKLIYYIKPVFEEDELKSRGNIHIEKDGNIIYAKNKYRNDFLEDIYYVSTNEKITSYTGDKDFFIGESSLERPEAIDKVSLDNEDSLGKMPCIAIEIKIEMEAYENKELVFLLGAESDRLCIKDTVYKYEKAEKVKEELNKTKQYWYELLDKLKVKTPLESMNLMLNGWAIYQTITARLWGKTGYYQSGGATGFRDQLQDVMSLKFIEPEIMKNQIIYHAAHQFIEGDVEHWWHEETKRGIRTRFSDDLLWLCFVVLEYIDMTGDYKILDIEIPYLSGEILEEGVDEKYDIYRETEEKGSLYEHCVRAIDRSVNFGENGLPKIGSGDWNDGLNTVGNKGIGESVWLGFFLYDILSRFNAVCEYKKDFAKKQYYEDKKESLKKALNTKAWDGRWFKRAFTDDGQVLGSIENEECRIDSISQSWGIISNAADNDKKYISLESLENHLIDKENGIIKLLDPPFENGKINPGYIKSYLPGVRENGGQYTHAAIWVILALTKLGFGDKAIEYFRMITSIEHARTKEAATKYKLEPYVIAADIYGANNLIGRGGWSWYTGSSGWFYKVGIEYILGLKIRENNLSIEPCISKEWQEYSIRYRYKSSVYNIKVKNPNKKNTGVEKFIFNGQEIEEKKIRLIDDGKVNEIEIIM